MNPELPRKALPRCSIIVTYNVRHPRDLQAPPSSPTGYLSVISISNITGHSLPVT